MSFDPRTLYHLGTHAVPAIWPYLAPEEFRYMEVPEERCASCDRCPKIAEENFDKIYRCCTYHPRIPNFLMGWALDDPSAAPQMTALMQAGFATPEGLHVTPTQHVASLAAHVEDRFGKAGDVLCQFLDTTKRQCGIYPYRNSVCSTFFCINDGGDPGEEFWQAMQNFMGQMESAVAQWAMEQAGIDPASYFERYDGLAHHLSDLVQENGGWSDLARENLWDHKSPDMAAFFRACAQAVETHREDLYELVADRPLLRPHAFDMAFRDQLSPQMRAEMDANGGVGGDPVSPRDLWYQLDLAHRTLWQLPPPGTTIEIHADAEWQTREDERFPHVLQREKQRLYLNDDERNFLLACRSPQPINNKWIFGDDAVDGRRLVTQALSLGLLTTK